ncbi:uncharacterized protein LOC116840535 [Odontomachus brunneus]|uniref:uncharacterized protein LOC116840535 n=1 Tax=Odontomachus brunneus TaxID=486640 RepID=UPI0013F27823|nr:uncharacterized protein LOC116840535 [Odontomachus brunneus]
MLSRVSLVAILLALNCLIRAVECTRSPPREKRHETEGDVAPARRLLRYTRGNVTSEGPPPLTSPDNVAKDKLAEVDFGDAHSKIGVAKEKDRPRDRKKRMDRTMMALLMAYKLKFIALIPTMIGGLILLKGTTLLAGFFFALFAAVLGLKVH